MPLFRKTLFSLAITSVCTLPTVLQAQTITWTDDDFSSPRGSTQLYGTDVTINTTDTAKFEGYIVSDTGLLTLDSNSILTAQSNVSINNTGTMGDALLVLGNSKATFNGDLFAENTNSANGYYSIGNRGGSELHVNGKTTVYGVRGISTLENSSSFFNDLVEVNAKFAGVDAETSSISFKDININLDNTDVNGVSFALKALNSGQVDVDGTFNININVANNNNWIYGVLSQNQSTVNLKDTNIVFTNNEKTGGEVGLYSNNSNIAIDGNLTILNSDSSNSQNYAIFVTNNGQVTSTNSLTYIDGNLRATSNGMIDLTMSENSYWQGKSTIASDGVVNIDMNKTRWDMNNTSILTNLTANQSNIKFLSSPNNFFTLTTQNLSGTDNTFNMNTDLGSISSTVNSNGERIGTAGVNGDLLVISGNNTATNNTLIVNNNGSAATQGNEVLQIVSTAPNNQGDFHLSSAVEAGGYQYGLRQTTDPTKNGWELFSTGTTSSTAKAAVNSYFNVSYLLSYIDNQTLLQRMGELRGGEGKQGSFWMRAYGGKLNSFSGQKLDGFDMNYAGTQLGIDKQLQLSSGDLYLGLMASYVKADPDYKAGSGTAKSVSTGGYLTYLDNNGFYFDTVLKYTNIRNKFSVRDTQNNSVQGHTQSNGYGVSFEFGRQFKLGKSNFYIEPQFQLAYQYQDGDKASATNGLEIKMDDYDSVLGRASGIVGYKMTDSKNLQLNLYAKTGVVQEFAGNTSYRLNGNKEKFSFNGAWFDNGIGVNAKINNRHNIYGELDYAAGHRFDKVQASIGYRLNF